MYLAIIGTHVYAYLARVHNTEESVELSYGLSK